MNCDEFEMSVLTLARDRLMDAEARELSLAHTRRCARCAERLAEERTLFAAVRAVILEVSGEGAPARVETALLAAYREHAPATTISPALKTVPGRSGIWTKLRLAAAAMILILISVMAAFWSQSETPGETQSATTLLPVTRPVASAPAEHQDRSSNDLANNTPQLRSRKRALRARPPEAELVTEFYPLTHEEDLDSLEVFQVVRVELPGSALRAAGLSVGPAMASEPVKADVMLGHDGLARAIRFVR